MNEANKNQFSITDSSAEWTTSPSWLTRWHLTFVVPTSRARMNLFRLPAISSSASITVMARMICFEAQSHGKFSSPDASKTTPILILSAELLVAIGAIGVTVMDHE